jgi:ribonuclease I
LRVQSSKSFIKKQDLYKQILRKLPNQNKNNIDLVCNSNTGILEEIRIKLDKNIEKISNDQWRNLSTKDLSKYISKSSLTTNNCGKNIILRK